MHATRTLARTGARGLWRRGRPLARRPFGVYDDLKKRLEETLEKDPALKETVAQLREGADKMGKRVAHVGEATKAFTAKTAERLEDAREAAQERISGVGDAAKKAASAVEDATKAARTAGEKLQQEARKRMDDAEEAARVSAKQEKEGEDGKEEEKPAGAAGFVNNYKAQSARTMGMVGALQSFMVENVREGWKELTGGQSQSTVRVRVGNKERSEEEVAADEARADAEEAAAEERSTRTELVKTEGPESAWQRLSKRLREAPIIRGVLKSGRAVYRDVADSSLGKEAKKVGAKVQDRINDVKEAWETSQHPIVYGLSSAWDSLTAETEEGYALRELRRLDPGFNPETWRFQVTKEICPGLLAAYLKGSPREMKAWVGEGVYNRIAEEMRARKAEGLEMDQHVLDIETGEILAMKVEEGSGPTIVIQFMAQQIHCVRKRSTGEVVEGAEDQIKAYFYALAFNQIFDDEEMEVRYEVVDFMPVGSVPYY